MSNRLLSQLSIRNQLMVVLISLLALLSISSYLSFKYFDRSATELHQLVEEQSRRTILAQRASQHAQASAYHLLRLLQTDDREQRKPMYTAMDSALAMSDAAIRTLAKEPEYVNVRRLFELRARYGELFQQTVETIEFEGLEPARRHYSDFTHPVLTQLLEEAEQVSIQQMDRMLASEQQLLERGDMVELSIISLELLITLLGLGFAVYFARGFAGHIERTIAIAGRIASGDYDNDWPSDAASPEMSRLQRALEQMRRSILTRELYIKRLAYEDSVTRLKNRNYFFETLRERLDVQPGAIILLDINRFSKINQALGHDVGDIVLREVGKRLARPLAPQDELVRLEGNKFAALIAEVDAVELLEQRLSAMLSMLGEPINVRDQRLDIDLSAGAVLFPEISVDVNTLLRTAEEALRTAKARKEPWQIRHQAVEEIDQNQLTLYGELRTAVAEQQLVLHYQPKFDLHKRRIGSVEALVRWIHPSKGAIRPDLFIPFAESTGFVRQITPWVIRQAVTDAAELYRQGVEMVFSVNISALDLTTTGLVDLIREVLASQGLPPRLLCLEVTESALMDDPELSLARLFALKALGVRLSIDDYGTGLASLAYVRDLPVDELKVDRSFISGIDQDTKNAAIVWSTLLMCNELGISVVAEGVETDQELRWLLARHCDQVQGYRISRPLALTDLLDWYSDSEQLASLPV